MTQQTDLILQDRREQARKFLSLYQVLGGLWGLVAFGLLRSSENGFTGGWIATVIIFGLFAISVIAGVLLLLNNRSGYTLSVLIQLLQIPVLITGRFTYVFVCGLQIGAALSFGSRHLILVGIRLFAGVGGSLLADPEGSGLVMLPASAFLIGVNIIPLLLLWFLCRKTLWAAEGWRDTGLELMELGQHEKALVMLDRAIGMVHEYAEAWESKADVLDKLGRTQEAAEARERAARGEKSGLWGRKWSTLNSS